MSTEQEVMGTIQAFTEKYLKEGEQLLGFVVMDDDGDVICASTFNANFVNDEANPMKNWVIYQRNGKMQARELSDKDDFKKFVQEENLMESRIASA